MKGNYFKDGKNVTACSKVGCQCFVDILGQRD